MNQLTKLENELALNLLSEVKDAQTSEDCYRALIRYDALCGAAAKRRSVKGWE